MSGITGGEARVEIAAPLAAVWARVSDPTRVGEWSPECRGGKWLDGADGPGIGVRFRGNNRRGAVVWATNCEIVEFESERAIAWEVHPPLSREASARWGYEVRALDNGNTEVIERWQLLKPSPLARASWVIVAGTPDRRLAMVRRSLDESLAKLKTVMESEQVGAAG